jgi:large subunit ribosomal protein L21
MADKKLAIFKINNKQYFANEQDSITIDRINGEVGSTLVIDQVLLLVDGDKINLGTPLVEKAKINAEIIEHKRGDKVRTFTYKAKSRYRKTHGQRQNLTVLKITKID